MGIDALCLRRSSGAGAIERFEFPNVGVLFGDSRDIAFKKNILNSSSRENEVCQRPIYRSIQMRTVFHGVVA